MTSWRFSAGVLLFLLAVITARPAAADSAPLRPIGPTLQPMSDTQVRMEAEWIEIVVGRAAQTPGYFNQNLTADVKVRFRFMPGADETMTAGFPLRASLPNQGMYGELLRDFVVTVAGQPLRHEEREVTWERETTPWAVWQLAFRKGEPLDLEVRYRMDFWPGGKGYGRPVVLHYILRSGRYWEGTIGRAEAVVRYAGKTLTAGDVQEGTTPGWQAQGGALFWEWRELEPDFDLALQLSNPFWGDTAAILEEMLSKPNLTPGEMRTVYNGVQQLLPGADRYSGGPPMRDGRSSEEAGMALVPRLLEVSGPALATQPADLELWQQYVGLRFNLAFEHGPAGWRLRRSEAVQEYLEVLGRLQQMQLGGQDPRYAREHAVWTASLVYQGSPDEALRKSALELLRPHVPSFVTRDGALYWVKSTLDPQRYVFPADLVTDVEGMALAQVMGDSPGSGSGGQEVTGSEPGGRTEVGPAPENPSELAPGRLTPWVFLVLAGVLAAVGGILAAWRRGKRVQ